MTKEKKQEYRKQWGIANPDKVEKYSKSFKLRNPDYHKNWWRNNYDRIKQKRSIRYTQRKNTDPQFMMARNLRSRLRHAINGKYKAGSAVKDLGRSISDFIKYIESKFLMGMTWYNWRKDGWHLDHIIPLSKFNLQDRQQFLIANHYTNLHPMWAKDNLTKSNLSVLDYTDGMF
jgi:hypothetical protein